MAIEIKRLTPIEALPLSLAGKLVSALAPLQPANSPVAFVVSPKPLLTVSVHVDGHRGQCILTGTTETAGDVFSGSGTFTADDLDIAVKLTQVPARFASLTGPMTWTLLEVGTRKSPGSATVPMECYFLPQDPGDFFRNGLSVEVLRELAAALGFMHGWSAATDRAETIAQIVARCFNRNPPRYDIYRGAPAFTLIPSWNAITLQLNRYLNAQSDPNAIANCYDLAAVLQYYLRAAGAANVRYAYMNPFGYLRQTNLIGRGTCNNPFYGSSGTSAVLPVQAANRTAFGNHAFCQLPSGAIADACAGPHSGSEAVAAYVASGTDDQFIVPPKVPRGTVNDITYYTGVANVVDAEGGPPFPNPADAETFLKSVGSPEAPAIGADAGPPTSRIWPDPLTCPELGQGWTIGFSELVAGYPESHHYWRLRNGSQSLEVTIYVASMGDLAAYTRFVILGSVQQVAGPIYQAGPKGLGSASAEIVADGHTRIFWHDRNAVVDLSWTGDRPVRPDLHKVAQWLASAAKAAVGNNAAPPAPTSKASTKKVKVGGSITIDVAGGPNTTIQFLDGPDGLRLVEADGSRLTFQGRKPCSGDIRIAAVNNQTLLSGADTVPVEVRD